MKKFLSVLLALAVAFTFTFGSTMSAFAAAPTTDQVKLLDEALAYAQTQVDNNYAKAYDAAVKTTIVGKVTVSQASWDAVGVKALIDKYLNDTYLAQGSNYTATGDNYKAVAQSMYNNLVGASVDTEAALTTFITTNYGKKAALNQYKADLAELDKAIDNVDYDLYSTNVDPASATGMTYLEEAKAAVDAIKTNCKAALRTAGACNLTEETVIADYVAKKAAYRALIIGSANGLLTEIMIGSTGVGTGKYLVNGVTTKTGEANTDTTNKATAAAVKAKAQALYAADITAHPENKDADDAWVAVVNYLADAYVLTSVTSIENRDKCVDAVAAINGLNIYANKYKAETDASGNAVRDAAEVDKIVKATTIDVYSKALAGTATTVIINGAINTAETNIAALTSEGAAKAFAFDQEARIAAIKAEQEAAVKAETYYPAELEKYNAAVEAAIAKVKAAKITDNLALITVDTADILTADDVDDTFEVAPLSTEFGKQVTAISNTINNVKNYGKTVLDPTYIVCNDVEAALLAYCGENGIRTVDEVKAISAEDFISTLPTRGQIKDGKTAAETAIKAIPTVVKYADKATVEAAYDAAQAYAEIMGVDVYTATDITNADTLTAAINTLYLEMGKDFAVKVYQVNKTDKVALKALKAEFDAANVDETRNGAIGSGMFEGKNAFDDSAVDDALASIRTNELNAVKAAIAALPINLTAADKAAVEAARAAYDAYVAEYTDPTTGDNAATDLAGSLKALQNAEAAIAELAPAYDNQDAKADLLDMSRKLTIWRTSKTSIRVTSVGSVADIKDHGYTVQYKFYKKAPGAASYKLVKTTSSNKYTYTNLKKGTNKFQVKVVVKDADGKVVATKMTYYRAAKVK